MEAGHADIVDAGHVMPEQVSGHRRFLRDGQVAGAGAEDCQRVGEGGPRLLSQGQGAGGFMVLSGGNFRADRRGRAGGRAGGKDIAAVLRHAGKNRDDLRVGFALAINHLRHAGAQRAMMIDLGKARVLEWEIGKTCEGLLGRGSSVANGRKQFPEAGRVHRG